MQTKRLVCGLKLLDTFVHIISQFLNLKKTAAELQTNNFELIWSDDAGLFTFQ